MLKTTEPVIIMTRTELEAVIDAAAQKAVGEVVKKLDQLRPKQPVEKAKQPVEKERGDWVSAWVRAERYCQLSGEPMEAVYSRIRDGEWAAGKHYKRTGPRTLWINPIEVSRWIDRHPHVETGGG